MADQSMIGGGETLPALDDNKRFTDGGDTPKPRRIMGLMVDVRRAPPRDHPPRLWPLTLAAGLVLVVLHDLVYRRTEDEPDLELGIISHAALDMLVVSIVLTGIVVAWEMRRR